jgi:tetratricopeptide (TPR) repeat protein/SAM-dependent methyltransferase
VVAVSESLQQAIEHHKVGELEQAEALYREIIRIDPGHADALHLLGVAAHQKSDHRTGADYISRAIARGGKSALSHSNLGACYRSMNQIPDAIAAFREAVRLEPGFVEARYNLAMALEASGSVQDALREYREVLRIKPDFVPALNNLGSLLSSLERCDEAAECFRRAIKHCPNSAEFHYNLGNVLSRSGHCEEAVREYRESIRLNPHIPETYNNLATALNALGRSDEALLELRHALALRPDYAEAQVNEVTIEQAIQDTALAGDDADRSIPEIPLPVSGTPKQWCEKGSQLQNEGRFDEATDAFTHALKVDPDCAAAYFGLGYGLLVHEKHEEAGKYYEQGLLVDDANAPAWNNLGSIYMALENWEGAIACYESALQIDAAYANAHYNLGNVYKEQGQPLEASACYRRALYIDPKLAEAHINLGVTLVEQHRVADAATSHTRAVQVRPENAEAHFHRALAWLIAGDFEQGWDEYEWRFRHDVKPRDFPFLAWSGRGLDEKTILVHAEQGIGDEIMFASCLPEVVATSSQCVIECDPRLVPLFARSFPLADVVGRPLSIEDAEALGIDVHIAAGSLPRFLRRNLGAFPRRLRYLAACPFRRARWRERYAQLGNGLKVGISWRGGGTPYTKRRRSTSLEQWKPILAVPGVQFVNLQYGDCARELAAVKQSLGVTIHHWDDVDPLTNLEDFAAQTAELDLVISIDNATVHMAGALGVPVWTLLHFAANWRWLLDRDDSPWYASLQLVRQPEFGKWTPVFASVSESLGLLSTARASKTTTERSAALSRLVMPPLAASPLLNSAPHSAAPSGCADPQAEEERAKYKQVWKFDDYRRYSPGADAIEKVGLVDTLRKHSVRTILDAGCGSGKLMWRLMNDYPGEFDVHGFDITDNCLDPCFGNIKDRVLTLGCLWNPDDFTKVYDAVICCDVMEHIPTERVPAVLANLRKSTRRFAFFSISVVPDSFGPMLIGEALHLTVQKPNWWFAKLALAGFKMTSYATGRGGNGCEAQLYVFATV